MTRHTFSRAQRAQLIAETFDSIADCLAQRDRLARALKERQPTGRVIRLKGPSI